MKMGGNKGMNLCAVLVMMLVGGKWVEVEAEVHHVVGGDRGWDPASDLVSWSSGRVFRVGDQIWLTYSVAQGLVGEVKSREEYEACDVRKPIKMYTQGLHSIPLESEGMRYFVSTDPDNCKNGLKLHLQVLPNHPTTHTTLEAAAPATPSASPPNTLPMLPIIFCLIMGLAY
ncbi:hypothetical protein RJT34_14274 [Clitoria ternatea]|uniref:Phytocyanin domain-containing protein n=1 Tax=Clitoria ternatea TaxID=43366 RepID=A0AAN9JQ29_CLITE